MSEPTTRKSRVQSYVENQCWAILPSAMDLVLEVADRHAAGVRLEAEEIDARISAARRLPHQVTAPGSIAVLPLVGVIAQRMNLLSDISGGVSTEAFGASLQSLVNDPAIAAIIIDVDSPGGSVYGVEELADKIHGLRGSKPIVAVANSMAASAAYWLASQADELVVTPSGEVGSIGVITYHDDVSAMAEREGVRRTYLTAGKYKAEGNAFEPLSEDTKSYMLARLEAYHEDFIRAVARGRKVSAATVRESFGQGRLVGAAQAVQLGMADREETMQQTIDRLASRNPKAGGSRAELERDRIRRQAELAELERR